MPNFQILESYAVGYSPQATSLSGVALHDLPDALAEAYQKISDSLAKPATSADIHALDLADEPGGELKADRRIVGVAIGSGEGSDAAGLPGEPVVRLYVSQQTPPDSAAQLVAAAFGVESLASGHVPYEVVHTGPIDLLAHRMRMRPAPGGISCGHFSITAGTLGCLAKGRNPPRSALKLIVSNNHVLADVNAGKRGDAILQPGPFDGGKNPADKIGELERFVTIDFANPNYVDCATAAVEENDVRPEQLQLKGGTPNFFKCGTTPVKASAGLTVGKSGRTTQLTSGRVTGTGVTIRVNMGGGRVAVFRDQIEIRGLAGHFSQGGDSGSLIWTWDEKRQPVGLLFAGGSTFTFANPIDHVLNALDIDLI